MADPVAAAAHTPPSPHQVFRICTNLKHLVDSVVPLPFAKGDLQLRVLTPRVVTLALLACGGAGNGEEGTSLRKYRAVSVFALLRVAKWYSGMALLKLFDFALFELRELAAQLLAKKVIAHFELADTDMHYLFLDVLCQKYSIMAHEVPTAPANVMEVACDMHLTIVISAAGYQRCVQWLWRGWIVRAPNKVEYVEDASGERVPSKRIHDFVVYPHLDNQLVVRHFDPDRLKLPVYQNHMEIAMAAVYLGLYTVVVNDKEGVAKGVHFQEAVFHVFTVGFVANAVSGLYYLGANYLTFFNGFNLAMYSVQLVSLLFRVYGLHLDPGLKRAMWYSLLLLRLFAMAAPLMWARLLLLLDTHKYVGIMLLGFSRMMKESLLFYVTLLVILAGFTQGFIGLDVLDGRWDQTGLVLDGMVRTIIGGMQYGMFTPLLPPYLGILYYIYAFVVAVVLLKILVALFNQLYRELQLNANHEYLALLTQKTLRYIRAPDDHVFVPPLNLVEIALVLVPFLWWADHRLVTSITHAVMQAVYAPYLAYIAWHEAGVAKQVLYNRRHRLPDDANEADEEWDLTDGFDLSEQETEDRNRVAQEEQAAAEAVDPEFSAPFTAFFQNVPRATPPVKDAKDLGVEWVNYGLLQELRTLKLILTKEIARKHEEEFKELREELAAVKTAVTAAAKK